ncbi:DivIVA domain-containing protein [Streptomyces sp. NPDC005970]|uniref:DivIVA domain-containing protein n=1 Tax=Streptomyces sp. NPDC005970 TaxID=3156723 RepID=UPI0033D5A081
MFWFLLIALVVVVGAVTLAVVGGGDGSVLPEAPPDRLDDALPADRPLGRADVEALRLPMTVRGYRMADVDDVLGRLGAELAERDARIAELETALAGAHASARGGPGPLKGPGGFPPPDVAPPGFAHDLPPHDLPPPGLPTHDLPTHDLAPHDPPPNHPPAPDFPPRGQDGEGA